MALNIKNLEVEQLAQKVSELTKESKTEAIRKALQERKLRLVAQRGRSARGAHILEFPQGSI